MPSNDKKKKKGGHEASAEAPTGAPSAFSRLQKRSFGGEDVAARPGAEDDAWWPKGQLLPGVKEVIQSFLEAVEAHQGLALCFLLGGAGNGKSYAARALGEHLGLERNPHDSLAHRSYKAQRGATIVELLNDATIAPGTDYGENQGIALALDLTRWAEAAGSGPVAAFCCVNRGIIIDELRELEARDEPPGPLARAILSWLATPEKRITASLEHQPAPLPPFATSRMPHLRQEAFLLEGNLVWVAALSVDASSLMEPVTEGELSRAGSLFADVAARCREDAEMRPALCPLRANVAQWLPPEMIGHWERAMSWAEIASGRPHSYREVWGLTALSLVGPRFVEEEGTSDILAYIDQRLRLAEAGSSTLARLSPLVDLARFRAHEALFRAAYPGGIDLTTAFPPTTPAHVGLSLLDPSAWGSDVSGRVERAMQAISIGGRPSTGLASSGELPMAWAPFDEALERALIAHVLDDSCPDGVRRRLISWWGGYMLRLIGLATGKLGNSNVIEAWRRCWRLCETDRATLPQALDGPIRALLYPPDHGGPANQLLLPAFAARAEPLRHSRDGQGATLAELVTHSGVEFYVARAGSRLMLECMASGRHETAGYLVLDFPLIREALACRDGRAGQTESSAFIEPRIERCRAATIQALPASVQRLVALSGGDRVELSA